MTRRKALVIVGSPLLLLLLLLLPYVSDGAGDGSAGRVLRKRSRRRQTSVHDDDPNDPNDLGMADDAGHLFTLYGGIASLGEYYVHIDIGSPAQRLRVQVDTGSSSLIVPASECTTCQHSSMARRRRLWRGQRRRQLHDRVHSTAAATAAAPPQPQAQSQAALASDTPLVSMSVVKHDVVDQEVGDGEVDAADANGASAWAHVAKFYSHGASGSSEQVSCASSACGLSTCSALSCGFPSRSCGLFSNFACCSALEPQACGFYLEYGGDSEYSVSASGSLVLDRLTLTNSGSLPTSSTR
jgi:hypothetical protein